jgi:hypothetical protein
MCCTTRQLSFSVVLFLVCVVCGGVPAVSQTPTLPPGVVVLPGASSIAPETHRDGTKGVKYELNTAYPATAALDQLRKSLSKDWRPLKDDWLNPGQPSSHSRGWTSFLDSVRKPEAEVHQWLAQWQDVHGNVVIYNFQYRSKPGATLPDNSVLRVTAAWIPAKLAESMMDNVRGVPAKRGL